MRFCRYCGAVIPPDSLFCPKCGKNLGPQPHPRRDRLIAALRLKTPYPYFLVMVAVGLTLGATALRPKPYDYSPLKWSVRSDRPGSADTAGEFHQTFWLIVENTGAAVARDIPVEVRARVEPASGAAVSVRFEESAVPLPPGASAPLILGDPIDPGAKHLYRIDGMVRAAPPFTVTYEVDDREGNTLTRYAAAY
jgi:hypothetical protein